MGRTPRPMSTPALWRMLAALRWVSGGPGTLRVKKNISSMLESSKRTAGTYARRSSQLSGNLRRRDSVSVRRG